MDRFDMMDAICKTLPPGEELAIHVTSARGRTLVDEFILTADGVADAIYWSVKEGYEHIRHHWSGAGNLRDEYRRRVIEDVFYVRSTKVRNNHE